MNEPFSKYGTIQETESILVKYLRVKLKVSLVCRHLAGYLGAAERMQS